MSLATSSSKYHVVTQDEDFAEIEADPLLKQKNAPYYQRTLRTTANFALIHGVIFVIYTIAFVFAWKRNVSMDSLGIPFQDVTFEVNPALNQSSARTYAGEPSEELEAAWRKLLLNANIRIPEKEISRLDRIDQSVKFNDNSGYFGQMAVYHHLHCIRRLHRSFHAEHYWPNATAEEMFLLRAHNSHCLDTLRQAIMCQGDTSLITFRWGTKQPVPLGNFSSPHKCRSWESLDAWNAERFVDVFQPGLVVHPTLGPAYGPVSNRLSTGVVID